MPITRGRSLRSGAALLGLGAWPRRAAGGSCSAGEAAAPARASSSSRPCGSVARGRRRRAAPSAASCASPASRRPPRALRARLCRRRRADRSAAVSAGGKGAERRREACDRDGGEDEAADEGLDRHTVPSSGDRSRLADRLRSLDVCTSGCGGLASRPAGKAGGSVREFRTGELMGCCGTRSANGSPKAPASSSRATSRTPSGTRIRGSKPSRSRTFVEGDLVVARVLVAVDEADPAACDLAVMISTRSSLR